MGGRQVDAPFNNHDSPALLPNNRTIKATGPDSFIFSIKNQIYYFRYFLFFPFPLEVVKVIFCYELNGNFIFIVIIEFSANRQILK